MNASAYIHVAYPHLPTKHPFSFFRRLRFACNQTNDNDSFPHCICPGTSPHPFNPSPSAPTAATKPLPLPYPPPLRSDGV